MGAGDGDPAPARGVTDVGAVPAALADPTRRRVLDVLADEGQASPSRLARRLPVSRQAAMKHLRVPERAGPVAGGRAGRKVRPAPLDASARWLQDLAASWDR